MLVSGINSSKTYVSSVANYSFQTLGMITQDPWPEFPVPYHALILNLEGLQKQAM